MSGIFAKCKKWSEYETEAKEAADVSPRGTERAMRLSASDSRVPSLGTTAIDSLIITASTTAESDFAEQVCRNARMCRRSDCHAVCEAYFYVSGDRRVVKLISRERTLRRKLSFS